MATRGERSVDGRLSAIVPDGVSRAVPGFSGTATNQGLTADEAANLYIMDLGYVSHSSATTNVSVGGKTAPFDYKIVGAIVPVEDAFGTGTATARTLTIGTAEDADAFVDDYVFATDTATGALNIFSTATEWITYKGSQGDRLVYAVQQTTTATVGITGCVLYLAPRTS